MNHYIFRCSCGRWSVKEVRTSLRKANFKCVYCKQSRKIKKVNEIGLSMQFHGPYTGTIAAKKCAELNIEGKCRKSKE